MGQISLIMNQTGKNYTHYAKLLTLFVLGYFACNIVYVYFPVNERVSFYTGWFISLFAFLISLIRGKTICVQELLLYFFITLCNSFSLVYAGNNTFGMLITALSYYFIAMVIIRINLFPKYIKINYYLWLAFFVVNMGKNPSVPFTGNGRSQNFISLVLLIYAFLFVYSCWKQRRECLCVILSALALSLWSGCRGASISFSFLLASYLILTSSIHRKGGGINTKKIFIFVCSALCLGVFIFLFLNMVNLDSYLYLLKRPRSSIKGNVRFEMIYDYVQAANEYFFNMLFGVNLNSVPSIAFYDGNPHNSLILGHANYGYFFIMILTMGAIILLINSYKNSKIYMILLGTLFLRSFSDSIAFPGYVDSFFYLLLFEVNFNLVKRTFPRILHWGFYVGRSSILQNTITQKE